LDSYHKIPTIFKRDPVTKALLLDKYSLPEFEYLRNCCWEYTEKIDGTNIRVMWHNGDIRFGGKSDNAQIPSQLYDRLNMLFGDKVKMHRVLAEGPVCLYGEGCGPGIQKGGRMYGESKDFVLFDVKYGDMWLRREDVNEIGESLGLRVVPVIGRGSLLVMVSMVKDGFWSVVGDGKPEGIVARPAAELRTRRGDRVIVKLKSKDFTAKLRACDF
jgi:hypothetical protein